MTRPDREEHLDALAGYRPGWHDEDAPRLSPVDVAPAPVVRPGPDPLRDARIDAYRDRERRRAARMLDRFLETVAGTATGARDAAGERFVEAVGDYVLARIAESSDHDVAYGLQQNRHYGVPFDPEAGPCIGMCAGCDPSCHLLQHKSDYEGAHDL